MPVPPKHETLNGNRPTAAAVPAQAKHIRTPPGHQARRPGTATRTENRALYAPRVVFENHLFAWGGWVAPFRLKRS
jgi:hypothetical protein